MTNEAIAENFSLLGKLMDIHGDNSFKAKTYASAAFTIDKLPEPLSGLTAEKIFSIRGIGESTGKKIMEQLETGQLSVLQDYIEKTPPGILEMLGIKGIGPKKIATIWKELEIESLGELLYACNENRLTLYKGFGEKLQQNIKEAIEFYMGSLGSYLFSQIEPYAAIIDQKLKEFFPVEKFFLTGEFSRQLEIISVVSWVTTADKTSLQHFLQENGFVMTDESADHFLCRGKENVTLGFYCCSQENIAATLFETGSSEEFLNAWNEMTGWDNSIFYADEAAIFKAAAVYPIPSFRREYAKVISQAMDAPLPELIQPGDIKGIIHSHSNWSDGAQSLEEMATEAIAKGYEYLVISDHSKTAFYANGLSEEKVYAQHQQVEELNARFAPFTIFKSIESDILNDGALDYPAAVLNSFDIVIASVHSNLKMSEEKAMLRLLRAIENPYTSILGHMTGRLLLSRNGYPVNHEAIIDACAAHNVVIELNAHPRRLDIDWRWIEAALEKNVLISIDPDAHSTDGYNDCRYGVLAAQKAGVRKQDNLSSYSLAEFKGFVEKQKAKR